MARTILEMLPFIAMILDADRLVADVNPQFVEVTGRSLTDVQGLPWAQACTPGGEHSGLQRLLATSLTNRAAKGVHTIATSSGDLRRIEWHIRVDKLADGSVQRVVCIGTDVTSQARTEAALKTSEDRLRETRSLLREQGRTLYDSDGRPVQDVGVQSQSRGLLCDVLHNMFAFVSSNDLHGSLVEINQAPIAAAGLKRHEVIGEPLWDTFWFSHSPESKAKIRSTLERAGRGETVRVDLLIRAGAGSFMTIDAVFDRVWDRSERTFRVIGSGFDITDRKRSERQVLANLVKKEVLLHEVHHRIKNNFQMMASLLYLNQISTKNPHVHTILRQSRAQLNAMRLIHQKLLEDDSAQSQTCLVEYAQELTCTLLDTYNMQNEVEILVTGPSVQVSLERAAPYGLILNELITNSFKHAFSDQRCGTIAVRFESSAEALVMQVSDDGAGMEHDQNNSPTSLGLSLVARLTDQLGGTIVRSGPPGTTFRLVVPRPPPPTQSRHQGATIGVVAGPTSRT